MDTTNYPPELARVAQGRDFINTDEFARALGRSGRTARKNLCLTGHAWGVKPQKVGGRLLWPVSEVARLLTEGA